MEPLNLLHRKEADAQKTAVFPGHTSRVPDKEDARVDRDWVELQSTFPANFFPAWIGPQEHPALLRPFLFSWLMSRFFFFCVVELKPI